MVNLISAFSIMGYDTLSSVVFLLSFLMIPLVLWSIYVSFNVNSTYGRYAQVESMSNLTAYTVARRILDSQGLHDVQIRECRGALTDHYDPRTNIVFLSQVTINSTSVAAIGVAAHEVGHAIQHAVGYAPVKWRTAIVPVLNLASKILTPLLLINIFVTIFIPFSTASNALLIVTIIFYSLNMLFALVTLPCEYNASSRAKKLLLSEGILSEEEVAMTSKVLSAAAMTYMASFVMTLVQFLRLLLIMLSRSRRE